MEKKTFTRIIRIGAIGIFLIALFFFRGMVQSNRYNDPELDGEKLSVILRRFSHHEVAKGADIEILSRNKALVRNCVLGWLKERNKIAESFYLTVVETVEGEYFKLVEYRGAIWFHARALTAIRLLKIDDEEIISALGALDSLYSGGGFFIENDIKEILKK